MPGVERTRLRGCRRGEGEATLSLDGGEVLTVALESLPADLPPVGGEVEPDLLRRLREADQRKRIARRVFALLDRRLRPLADLRRRLTGEGFAPELVAAVLERFARDGVHSDARYAAAYCRDSLRRSPAGRRYLLAKLRERGVPAEVARRAVAEVLPPERERAEALAAARRRWAREARRDPRAEARVVRYLLGRGFPAALARRAVAEAAPDAGGER